jgi:hypothetical protein
MSFSILTHALYIPQLSPTSDPNRRLAAFKQRIPGKGVFKGEQKNVLIIEPNCPIDIDLLVLSFLIVEKKVSLCFPHLIR